MMAAPLAAILALATSAVGAPSFGQLEASDASGGAIAALAPILAPATPIATAQARLTGAGASCRRDRRHAGTVECLYHRYDLSDGAADDVRWTITLHADGDRLRDFTVRRYVDRHGTS